MEFVRPLKGVVGRNRPGGRIVARCMELTCPKCRGAMHTYERNSITIDQCGECRGVFLDRGELERLIDAEAAFTAAAATAAPVSPRPAAPEYGSPPPAAPYRHEEPYRREEPYRQPERYREYDSDRTPYPRGGGYGGDGYSKKRKKRSFLEDLFD